MSGRDRLLKEISDGLALAPSLWCHPWLWTTAREHGEDAELEVRAATALGRLPEGFYMPEKQFFSHRALRPVVTECDERELRLRLDLLALRKLIRIKRDGSGRLYRMRPLVLPPAQRVG